MNCRPICLSRRTMARAIAYQREAVERLHLPFALLSDEKLAFVRALALPTFEVDGMRLVKRLTLIVRDGLIEQVFYPVFPPDRNAEAVVQWSRDQARDASHGISPR